MYLLQILKSDLKTQELQDSVCKMCFLYLRTLLIHKQKKL